MYEIQHADSFAAWRSLVSSSFVPLETDPVRPGPFSGRLGGQVLRDVGLMRVEAGPHTVRRTPGLVASAPAANYKLNLQLSGHGLLLQDGRETVLRPGDLAIYDTERPYTLTFDGDFETLVLMFPHKLLGLAAEDVRQVTAVRMDAGQRLGRAVAPFLNQIAAMLPELEGPVGQRLALNVVDLVGTVLTDEFYSRAGQGLDDNARAVRRIQHYIDVHLPDPALDPGTVAAAHFISTRTLHKQFAATGHTVAGWIRERRLERCRRDLVDPLHADVPVGVIGGRWGLPDASHFSRLFRTAYGVSPAQYRRDADGQPRSTAVATPALTG
ncbi:helix-turn-helix domain-containing protein [Tersicoccus sp. Bi-70]|uniref:AraC-like ligand-binding domain-containing protein n=1 Tax=Tersicoccus sp. Bi-70 TaxID=1897634 RepID=UPI000975EE45|nr:helix-turn-helix domain-containing protein [Tersicoccus sp. Bi-70]OMH34098.1 AraC family transcriptional regulator [Tersicoccus sp. Bi-70]